MVLTIAGSDVGEFGDAPMLVMDEWLAGIGGVQLFIDARAVRGASVDVSGAWANWLERKKPQLSGITMLTGSPFVRITAEFVRAFAGLDGIMRICTEPAVFDKALAEATSWR